MECRLFMDWLDEKGRNALPGMRVIPIMEADMSKQRKAEGRNALPGMRVILMSRQTIYNALTRGES